MLELVFVIVILGIVASIGAEMIANVYEAYIVQRAEHRATIKTELAATQIANRLASAIPGTVVRRNALSGGVIEGINDFMSLDGDEYTVLQWVGSDMDSFSATATPGWSGFCDINTSTQTSISTPGSSLTLTNTIIWQLSGSTKTIADAAIYFPDDTNAYGIQTGSAEMLTLDSNILHIVEHYKLAWTSYALVVDNGDLYLYYNFLPERGTAVTGSSSLLMKNISTFKFRGDGRTIRFKICKEEPIGDGFNITACKEKAVF